MYGRLLSWFQDSDVMVVSFVFWSCISISLEKPSNKLDNVNKVVIYTSFWQLVLSLQIISKQCKHNLKACFLTCYTWDFACPFLLHGNYLVIWRDCRSTTVMKNQYWCMDPSAGGWRYQTSKSVKHPKTDAGGRYCECSGQIRSQSGT